MNLAKTKYNPTNEYYDNIDPDILLIRKRVIDNVNNSIEESCSVVEYDEFDALVITIDLERATDDNFKVFHEYVELVCNFKHKNYVIDLSNALFMDSVFLGSIIVFYKKVVKRGGNLSMVVNKDKVKILTPFEQLEKILNVKKTVNEALNVLKDK